MLGSIILILALLVGYWCLRPNSAQINPDVTIKSWDIANDGMHNSSPFHHDYVWILGMLSPSAVRTAEIDLKAMEALANQVEQSKSAGAFFKLSFSGNLLPRPFLNSPSP